MSDRIEGVSAKIYQFPVGGRRALAGGRDASKPITEVLQSRTAKVAYGGGWYHEEAIKQDALTDER